MASWYQWQDNNLIISIVLQPRAKRNEIVGIHGDALKIRITSPPVDGKANTQLCQYLAKLCDVSQAHIEILSGETNRQKRLCIQLNNKVIPAAFSPFC